MATEKTLLTDKETRLLGLSFLCLKGDMPAVSGITHILALRDVADATNTGRLREAGGSLWIHGW